MVPLITLTEAQNIPLDNLTAAVGSENVEFLAVQDPDVLNERVETLMKYEMTLIGKVQDQIASAMPKRFVSCQKVGLSLDQSSSTLSPTPVKRRKNSSSRFAR